jgi:WD40 repeat protein
LEIIWISTNEFVTIGIKHYKKWDVLDGKSLKGSNGQFGKNCNILCSLAFDEDSKNIYAGASDGSLQIWKGTSCTKSQKLHSGPIHALCIAENRILTGSGDKTIKILNLSDLA